MDSRTQRNLNPHAEARVAMCLWGDEYARLGCGSMNFWDGLSAGRKRQCILEVDHIMESHRYTGRGQLR